MYLVVRIGPPPLRAFRRFENAQLMAFRSTSHANLLTGKRYLINFEVLLTIRLVSSATEKGDT
jgi:hypothetical protein